MFVVLALVTSASCGDDDDKDASNDVATTVSVVPAAISKADFLVQANALCTTFQETLDAAAVGVSTEAEEAELITNVLVPELRSTLDAIRALGIPEGDEALLNGLFDETNALLDTFATDPTALMSAPANPFAETNAQLVEYGLTVCGS